MFIELLDSRKSRDFLYMRGFPDGRIPARSLMSSDSQPLRLLLVSLAALGQFPGSKGFSSADSVGPKRCPLGIRTFGLRELAPKNLRARA